MVLQSASIAFVRVLCKPICSKNILIVATTGSKSGRGSGGHSPYSALVNLKILQKPCFFYPLTPLHGSLARYWSLTEVILPDGVFRSVYRLWKYFGIVFSMKMRKLKLLKGIRIYLRKEERKSNLEMQNLSQFRNSKRVAHNEN
jgi:hypothetical protein